MTVADRLEKLLDCLRRCGSVLLAYSGGVDSALLLDLLVREAGIPCCPVFVDHPALRPAEREAAAAAVRRHGGLVLPVSLAVMAPIWGATAADRCYRCKQFFFTGLQALAGERGLQTVCDGTHAGDNPARPGRRALEELGIVSPLLRAGWDKPLIRRVARERGLAVWRRPAAACLAVGIEGPATADRLSWLAAMVDYLDSKLAVPLRLGLTDDDGLVVSCRPADRPRLEKLLEQKKLPPVLAARRPRRIVYRQLRGGALV
ncbi:MAG: TIGR00268 family protein [Deltaproteobacteria bacterium]|nr:TIGR00268 family protein [Deltaproteobacteria bacterium]